jgi:hypothetical protein
MIEGSADEGTRMVVSLGKPITLIGILQEMPPVERVIKEGKEILVMLKGK